MVLQGLRGNESRGRLSQPESLEDMQGLRIDAVLLMSPVIEILMVLRWPQPTKTDEQGSATVSSLAAVLQDPQSGKGCLTEWP